MIRKATLHDARDIANIHVKTWQAAYEGIVPAAFLRDMSADRRAIQWRDRLSDPTGGVLVAETENRIAGWASFGSGRDDDETNSGEIYAIYVHPGFWGYGFGRELMAAAEAQLRRDGAERITLWVFEENQRARRFYEKCAYAFDGGKRNKIIAEKSLRMLRYAKIFGIAMAWNPSLQ